MDDHNSETLEPEMDARSLEALVAWNSSHCLETQIAEMNDHSPEVIASKIDAHSQETLVAKPDDPISEPTYRLLHPLRPYSPPLHFGEWLLVQTLLTNRSLSPSTSFESLAHSIAHSRTLTTTIISYLTYLSLPQFSPKYLSLWHSHISKVHAIQKRNFGNFNFVGGADEAGLSMKEHSALDFYERTGVDGDTDVLYLSQIKSYTTYLYKTAPGDGKRFVETCVRMVEQIALRLVAESWEDIEKYGVSTPAGCALPPFEIDMADEPADEMADQLAEEVKDKLADELTIDPALLALDGLGLEMAEDELPDDLTIDPALLVLDVFDIDTEKYELANELVDELAIDPALLALDGLGIETEEAEMTLAFPDWMNDDVWA